MGRHSYPLPDTAQYEAIESLSFKIWLDSLIESKPELALSLVGQPMKEWLEREFKAKVDDENCSIWLVNDKESVMFVYLVYDKKTNHFRFFSAPNTDISPILQKILDQLGWFMQNKNA